MNNQTRSRMLIMAAEESLAEAEFSFKRGVWSLALRRTQEAVELDLAGVLAYLGVHFPKNHDQAQLLFGILRSQGLTNEETAKKIELISIDLSRKRGPALQQEEGYDEVVANSAIKDAAFVIEYGDRMLKLIDKKYLEEK